MRPGALLLLVLLALTLSAQEPSAIQSQVYVTAVDVLVDVRDKAGNIPPGLTPRDFILLEDGIERPVIGVEYLGKGDVAMDAVPNGQATTTTPKSPSRWQVVLYFETQLSSGLTRHRIAEELSKQADTLAALGKVDVVFADPTPRAIVRGAADAESIRQALQQVMTRSGPNRLALHRRQFLDEMQAATAVAALASQRSHQTAKAAMSLPVKGGAPAPESQSDFDSSPNALASVSMNTIRPYVQDEIRLIAQFRKNLMGWIGSYGRHTPRTLIMVTDGFDVDPIDFYGTRLSDRTQLRTFREEAQMGDTVNGTAKALAAAGWMTVSIPGDSNGDINWVDDASVSGIGRVHASVTSAPTINVKQLLQRPLEPLGAIADATGGSVVANSGKVAAAISAISDRIQLTYQVDRQPDGKPRKVRVRARDAALNVRSAEWVSSATPDQIAQTRAIHLLALPAATGDFPVETAGDWNPAGAKKTGTLRVTAPLDGIRRFLPNPARASFRVTMAIHVPPNNAFAVNSLLRDYDLADGTFRFRAPIDVPANAKTIVLVIEELSSGFWGTARIDIP